MSYLRFRVKGDGRSAHTFFCLNGGGLADSALMGVDEKKVVVKPNYYF